MANIHNRSREKVAMAVVASIIIAVLGYIIWLYMTGKSGTTVTGPSPSPTTTTTSAPSPTTTTLGTHQHTTAQERAA
jgi:hypothetical protein